MPQLTPSVPAPRPSRAGTVWARYLRVADLAAFLRLFRPQELAQPASALERLGVALLASGLVAVIGAFDHWTGPIFSFSIFYLVPIGVCTWRLGMVAGYVTALMAAGVWFAVESSAVREVPLWILQWNATVRLAFFAMFVALTAAVRRSKHELEAEVARQTARVREIADATSRNQARLARDLHDGMGQYLSGLALRTRMLADDLEADGAPHAANARRLVEVIQTVARESRRLDHFLGGMRSLHEDLATALTRLAGRIDELFEIECQLALPGAPLPLQPMQADMLFHIAQEATNNAIKHAGGRGLALALTRSHSELHLRIMDDGPGLPQAQSHTPGAGLRTMQQRAELIGASLRIGAGPTGRGVSVECVLDLPATPPIRPQGSP